jgi:GNAT superfamily N-acetyltransferase
LIVQRWSTDVIEICVLSADDWEQWRALRLRALAESPSAFGSRLADWLDAGEAQWRQRLSVPGGLNVIARVNGRDAGMASGLPVAATGVVELVSMWVAPEARGRGAGDVLVATIVAWARERGAVQIRLDVTLQNAHAGALYARHGFVELPERSNEGERAMGKALVPAPT